MSPESQRRVARQLAADAVDREDRTKYSDGILYRMATTGLSLGIGGGLYALLLAVKVPEAVSGLVVVLLLGFLAYLGLPLGLPRRRRW